MAGSKLTKRIQWITRRGIMVIYIINLRRINKDIFNRMFAFQSNKKKEIRGILAEWSLIIENEYIMKGKRKYFRQTHEVSKQFETQKRLKNHPHLYFCSIWIVFEWKRFKGRFSNVFKLYIIILIIGYNN